MSIALLKKTVIAMKKSISSILISSINGEKAIIYPKSDPLDAQTISTIIGTDDDVRYVSDSVFENKNGYQDLKALVHRHYQI